MSEVIDHLNSAQQIINGATQNCGGPEEETNPPRTENTLVPDRVEEPIQEIPIENTPIIVENSPMEAGPPAPDAFPLQTWTLEGEVNARVYRIFDVGVGAEFSLVQMSDGNYQLKIDSGYGGSFDIPKSDLGVEANKVNGLTFTLSPDEVALLSEALPLPDDAVLPHADPSNASLNLVDNISAVSFSKNLGANLEGLGVPLPNTDVVDRLTGFDIPESVSLEGEVNSGFEVRRDSNGNWEIVKNVGVNGEYSITTDSESPGGFWGTALDTATPLDLDNITTTGSKVDVSYEQVYNTGTGEFYTKVIETTTSFEGSGSQFGVDIPLTDEIAGTPNHSTLERLDGTFTTETTETIMDSNGNVISQQTSDSGGIFRQGSSDLVASDAEIRSTYEGHSIPEQTEG